MAFQFKKKGYNGLFNLICV